MAIKIGSNIASLGIQRQLSLTTDSLSQTSQRLASGLRINSASDDAAGLAIASLLNTDQRVFAQGIRNISDGVSLLNIADGALQALSEITTRQLELTEQAANGTYTLTQRKSLHSEANQLVDEYNRIIQSTRFNGVNLFQGEGLDSKLIQAGYGLDGSLTISTSDTIAVSVGTGSFNSVITSNVGTGGIDVVSGDLNNDGYQDIVVKGGNYMGYAFGNGDGSFQAMTTVQTYAFAGGASAIEVKDLNNDGFLDIIGVDYGTATVLYGYGNGSFSSSNSYQIVSNNTQTRGFAAEDVNNDGNLDLVIQNYADGEFGVRLGNGNGTFGDRITSYGDDIDANGLVMIDINGDGQKDVVLGGFAGLTVSYGNGDGSFGARSLIDSSGYRDVEAADINGDGVVDLVASGNGNFIVTLLGNGDGTFRSRTSYDGGGGTNPGPLRLVDLNNDGVKDILTRSGSTNAHSVLLGNQDGTFNSAYSVNGTGSPVVATDINQDGVLDLVTSTGASLLTQTAVTVQSAASKRIYLLDQISARGELGALNETLQRIAQQRGEIGSYLQRLEVSSQNLKTASLNYRQAASRIEDSDVANDAAELVKGNIKQKVASAILAQANFQPDLALKLLGGR